MTKPRKARPGRKKVFRTGPTRTPWADWMADIFNVPADWTPPSTVTMSLARRTRIATYKARFGCPDGVHVDSVIRLKLPPEGGKGATLVSSEIRQRFTARAKRAAVAPPAWVHTPAQLVADLRQACEAYRVALYRERLHIADLKARIEGLERGILQAQAALEAEAGDTVWFDSVTTLWDHLNNVRDLDGDHPPPLLPPLWNPRTAETLTALPRDPATGRPVIA